MSGERREGVGGQPGVDVPPASPPIEVFLKEVRMLVEVRFDAFLFL